MSRLAEEFAGVNQSQAKRQGTEQCPLLRHECRGLQSALPLGAPKMSSSRSDNNFLDQKRAKNSFYFPAIKPGKRLVIDGVQGLAQNHAQWVSPFS